MVYCYSSDICELMKQRESPFMFTLSLYSPPFYLDIHKLGLVPFMLVLVVTHPWLHQLLLLAL